LCNLRGKGQEYVMADGGGSQKGRDRKFGAARGGAGGNWVPKESSGKGGGDGRAPMGKKMVRRRSRKTRIAKGTGRKKES